METKIAQNVLSGGTAYIAVLSNDAYFPGLQALAYSLKRVKAAHPLHVVMPTTADASLKAKVNQIGLEIIELPPMVLPDALKQANPYARWNDTFFKLQIFNLTQFDKIVFLDLDMFIVQNIDELFEKPHMSAVAAGRCAHDWWTGFNSGLMVIEPDEVTYNEIVRFIPAACEVRLQKNQGFGDQDVLNYYYSDWWNHQELVLPEIYNAVTFAFEEVCGAFGYENLKVIHYAEPPKPWQKPKWRSYAHILTCIRSGKWNRARMYWKYMRYLHLAQ